MNFSSPNGFMKNATGPIRHKNDGPAILGSAPLRQSHAREAKGPQLDKDFSRSSRSVLLIPTSERSGFADAHRDDGKRLVLRAEEKLTAFLELEAAIFSALNKAAEEGNRVLKKIINGGRTGADCAALDFAILHEIPSRRLVS